MTTHHEFPIWTIAAQFGYSRSLLDVTEPLHWLKSDSFPLLVEKRCHENIALKTFDGIRLWALLLRRPDPCELRYKFHLDWL